MTIGITRSVRADQTWGATGVARHARGLAETAAIQDTAAGWQGPGNISWRYPDMVDASRCVTFSLAEPNPFLQALRVLS